MKIKTVLLSLFFLAVCTGTAAAGTLFTTLGYAFTHERHVQSADGFTVKYGYREDGSSVGFMTSLSYLYSDSNPKGDGIRGDTLKIIKNSDIKYFGVGPYWHVTPVLSLYATAGVGRVAIQYRNRKDDVVTKTSYRRTGFGYGTGVIINLTENWMLKMIDVESYQHIIAVRNLRGTRLSRGRALKAGEIRRLFSVCETDKSYIGPRDAALLAVILGCGLRRSEAVSLDISDIVTSERALRVLGKGNKERLAYMPAGAWHRLQVWIEEVRGEQNGPLFNRIRRFDTLTNDRLTDQAVYHILQVRQKQASIAQCAPHDLRRTFATAMLDNGEDLITVRDAMGHASVTTTQQYDRRGEERLRAARERLNLFG